MSETTPQKTEIVIVLDRSGSMETIREDVIGGLNSFVGEQRKGDGECCLSVLQFDTEYDVVLKSVAVEDVPDWTDSTFVPRGCTALLDAIHRGAAMLEEKTSDSLGLLVIMTDGMENASKEATRDQVVERLERLKSSGCGVIYLGANQDAIQEGGALGVDASTAATYAANSAGVKGGMAYATRAASTFRSTGGEMRSLYVMANERSAMSGTPVTTETEVVTTSEAARVLGIGESTLRKMRRDGNGPEYVKPSPGSVRYRRQDLSEFLSRSSTT